MAAGRDDTGDTDSARAALESERDATQTLIASMSASLAAVIEATSDAAADDEHDPEGTTLAVERGHLVAQLARSRARLDEIAAALDRVSRGGYGICETCGEPIAAVRLEALPAARQCIRCATRHPTNNW